MGELTRKQIRTKRRVQRIRNHVVGQEGKLRFTVFASNKYISAQIIDDAKGETLVSAHAKELKDLTGTKIEVAEKLGALLAQKAKEKKVTDHIVFDKGWYKYHGRVRALAESARKAGLQF